VKAGKTKIVNIRGSSERKYPMSFDFLGFTIEPHYTKVKGGEKRILPRCVINNISKDLRQ
jgi:RNA-directed DNA polymerase